jgi:membrane protein DedA with SNARE-associated domain
MDLTKFLLYSGLGTFVWTAFLLAGGYLLEERYQEIQAWLNPVSNAVIAVLVAWYLYRVVTFRRHATG